MADLVPIEKIKSSEIQKALREARAAEKARGSSVKRNAYQKLANALLQEDHMEYAIEYYQRVIDLDGFGESKTFFLFCQEML